MRSLHFSNFTNQLRVSQKLTTSLQKDKQDSAAVLLLFNTIESSELSSLTNPLFKFAQGRMAVRLHSKKGDIFSFLAESSCWGTGRASSSRMVLSFLFSSS